MKVESAPDIKEIIKDIVKKLNLDYIDVDRLVCMRSFKSTSRAYARIWSLPKIWQKALGVDAHYVIEAVSENFDELSEEEKQKTMLHELCLPYEEKIVIEDGEGLKIKDIGELIENEFKLAKKINILDNIEWVNPSKKYNVISIDIKTRKVEMKSIKKLMRRNNKEKEIIKVITRDGRIIRTSPSHGIIFTKHGYSYEHPKGYVKLRNCAAKDILNEKLYIRIPELFSLPKLERKVKEINLFNIFKEKNRLDEIKIENGLLMKKGVVSTVIPSKLILDNELGRFFGFYLSEGSIDHAAGSVSFSFNLDEKEYHKFIKYVLKKRFNANPKERTTKNNCKVIYVYSRFLQDIISNILGFGEKARYKKIPPFVFYAPDEFIAGLIDGWFAGDGQININKRTNSIVLSGFSKSKELIFGILLLLNKLKIVGRLRRNEQDIAIQTFFLPKFMKYCNLAIKYRGLEKDIRKIKVMKHEKNFKDLKYIRIRRVKGGKYHKKYFYNIEVEKNKNFMHGSGIFTHNCHIPKTFSGAVLSHRCAHFNGSGGHKIKVINKRTVDKLFKIYKNYKGPWSSGKTLP